MDVVDSRAVVTDEFVFREIDIHTVTKEELSFKVPFSLRVQRSDQVHALLAYFTIDFAAPGVSKRIHFGTGPFDRYTHWKQTVFYLPKDLQTDKGDRIEGTLSCVPNGKNPRDLDISIEYKQVGPEGEIKEESTVMHYNMC